MNPELVEAVWQRGQEMPESDATHWRQDACGAWMRREHYGLKGDFGWKMEKVSPGGGETAENLRPFHWKNGYDIGNSRPRCQLIADRNNVPAERYASPPRKREA